MAEQELTALKYPIVDEIPDLTWKLEEQKDLATYLTSDSPAPSNSSEFAVATGGLEVDMRAAECPRTVGSHRM
jgi:hypothetical protein